MIQSAADDIQHFADRLHGLGQILHHLHIQIPPNVGVDFLQVADAGGQLADILHSLHKVLLHSHIRYLQKLSVKCYILTGSVASLNQAWRYYSIGTGTVKGMKLTSDRKILACMTCILQNFGQNMNTFPSRRRHFPLLPHRLRPLKFLFTRAFPNSKMVSDITLTEAWL